MTFVATEDANTDTAVDLSVARQFVSVLSRAFDAYDNSYASEDMYAVNPPRQYQVVGPYGTSVEGTTLATTTAQGGVYVSPTLVLIALGFAAALFWKR